MRGVAGAVNMGASESSLYSAYDKALSSKGSDFALSSGVVDVDVEIMLWIRDDGSRFLSDVNTDRVLLSLCGAGMEFLVGLGDAGGVVVAETSLASTGSAAGARGGREDLDKTDMARETDCRM